MANYLELFFNFIKQPVIQAVLCVFGSILAAKLADWIISRVLSRLTKRTSTTIDDQIIQILHRPIYFSILFMGLFISVQFFPMPEVITYIFKGLFKTIAVIIWSFALFQSFMHFLNWYGKKSRNDSIIKDNTLPIIDNIGKVVIFMLAIYFIIISWGYDVTGLLAGGAALSIILGFAAKDTISNLFAGFFIMADSPISLVTISIWMEESGDM